MLTPIRLLTPFAIHCYKSAEFTSFIDSNHCLTFPVRSLFFPIFIGSQVMPQARFQSILILSLTLLSFLISDSRSRSLFAQSTASRWDIMEVRLETKIASNPDDASSWRMLGRVRLKKQDTRGAYNAFARAVALEPLSAAAQYDFGHVLVLHNLLTTAEFHLKRAIELAPESAYASKAREQLDKLADSPADAQFLTVGFEVKRYDASDLSEAFKNAEQLRKEMEPPSTTAPVLDFRLETGFLYNSNVALTPLSRELSPGTRESFQAFISPEIEYRLIDGETWKAGPTYSGYTNINEGDFRQFNLQDFQPGLFVEQLTEGESGKLITRLQYDFTHEKFDGTTFGNRNALTLSGTSFWDRGDITYLYWSADYTNFTNDGVLPSVTSRDGWTNTLGISHAIYPDKWYLYSLRGGAEVQLATLDGSDYSYNGLDVYGSANVPLLETLSLSLDMGWGYRDYYDFEFTPSRNENIWRAGVKLRKEIDAHYTVTGIFNFDRFSSENVLFEAERFTAGVVFGYER